MRFENPLLISRADAIGILSIESSQEAACRKKDIASPDIMVGQIASSSENVRLLKQPEAALEKLENIHAGTGGRSGALALASNHRKKRIMGS